MGENKFLSLEKKACRVKRITRIAARTCVRLAIDTNDTCAERSKV